MTKHWKKVALGELLTLRAPDVKVVPTEEYQFAGVYCFGKGLFVGQKRSGIDFSYSRLTRVHKSDFVYPKLMAWEGAFAVVPSECEGLYVSPEFPVFEVDSQRLEAAYLGYYFQRPSSWTDVSGESKGTNVRRRRLHPADFLRYEIVLPPLREQIRLVSQLDAVFRRHTFISSARATNQADLHQLLAAAFHELTVGVSARKLGEIAPLTRRPATIDPFLEYPQVSVRSFGRGTFHNPPLSGSEVTWEKPHLVKSGDILISNIKAWEGAIAVARDEDDGRFGSHRYLTYVPVPGIATARFICFYLLTPDGLHRVGEASPGSADRNRTTSAKALLEIPVPLPTLERQLWFGKLYDRVHSIQQAHDEIAEIGTALHSTILEAAFRGEL